MKLSAEAPAAICGGRFGIKYTAGREDPAPRRPKKTSKAKRARESAVPIGIFKNIKFYRIALSNDVRNPSVQYPWDFSFSHSKVFILGQKRI